jgi:hypothetical protein
LISVKVISAPVLLEINGFNYSVLSIFKQEGKYQSMYTESSFEAFLFHDGDRSDSALPRDMYRYAFPIGSLSDGGEVLIA